MLSNLHSKESSNLPGVQFFFSKLLLPQILEDSVVAAMEVDQVVHDAEGSVGQVELDQGGLDAPSAAGEA